MSTTRPLDGLCVAFLVDDGIDEEDLARARAAVTDAGAKTVIVSPKLGAVDAVKRDRSHEMVIVELGVGAADVDEFDGLVLPRGAAARLRSDPRCVALVRAFASAPKPVVAIGRDARAEPDDAEIVIDDRLVASDAPGDHRAFHTAGVAALAARVGSARALAEHGAPRVTPSGAGAASSR